jgi:valyl-tRNA synthetase
MLETNHHLIAHLARTSAIETYVRGEANIDELSAMNSDSQVDVVIPLKGLIDVKKEIARLDAALEKITKQREGLEKRLSSTAFIEKAPPEVISNNKMELKALTEKEQQLILGKKRLMDAK